MARVQKLKVFRTPIGFHDAYVAAPSQKAALEAWGADSNLFRIGAAEPVEDPKLMEEPLANPGKVIQRFRGSLAEHMAALPKRAPSKVKTRERPEPDVQSARNRSVLAKPNPPPSRATLDRAEEAVASLERHQAAEMSELARRQAELDAERTKLERKHERELNKARGRTDAVRQKFEAAMRTWRLI